MAIFYDRFECLRVENRATLLSKTVRETNIENNPLEKRTTNKFFSRQAIPGQSLVDDCVRALVQSNWNAVSQEFISSLRIFMQTSIFV